MSMRRKIWSTSRTWTIFRLCVVFVCSRATEQGRIVHGTLAASLYYCYILDIWYNIVSRSVNMLYDSS